MSKSILVLDTPESCRKCKLRYDSYGQCEVCILADDVVDEFYETNTKPDWCPLSPLPSLSHSQLLKPDKEAIEKRDTLEEGKTDFTDAFNQIFGGIFK